MVAGGRGSLDTTRMKVTAVTAFAILLTACASVSLQKASESLDQGMSEDEVARRIGASPATVSSSNCGKNTGSWECKVWRYEQGSSLLSIYFAHAPDGQWRVDSWQVY